MSAVSLSGGCTLRVSRRVPGSASGRRAAALPGQLYVIGGRVDDPSKGFFGGYVGQTADLESGARPSSSFTNWVVAQGRIFPSAMGVMHGPTAFRPDFLRFLEARVIADLSLRGLWLLNTHTGAARASSRLSRGEVKAGQALAQEIAQAMFTHVFAGLSNPWPSPCSNRREAAVRVVWQADRALNTEEVLARMTAAGFHHGGARTPAFSTRRDLRRRESVEGTRGTPRVFTTTVNGRVLYYRPGLSRSTAVAGYLAAHRSGRRVA